MTLQNLRYILEVADAKSVSRAARALYMTQSALSTAIRETEEELGVQIFRRTNRGVSLTVEGEDCVRHCKEIVERADFLAARYVDKAAISASFSVSAQHLPFAVRAFNELLEGFDGAGYDVAMRETDTSTLMHDVSSEKSEIGVAALTGEQLGLIRKALYVNDLSFHELARLNTYVFLRRRHPLAEREAISLADLRAYPFVTYDQEKSPTYYSEESVFYAPNVRRVHVCDRATKMSVLRSSDAFSIGVDLTNFNQDIYFRRGSAELVAVPFADQAEPLAVGYLLKNGRAPSPIGEAYLRLLRAHIDHLQLPLRQEERSGAT